MRAYGTHEHMTLRILLLLRHKAKIKFLLRLLAERERQVPHARRLEELLPRDEARRLRRERVEVRRAEVAARDALRRVLVDALGQGWALPITRAPPLWKS